MERSPHQILSPSSITSHDSQSFPEAESLVVACPKCGQQFSHITSVHTLIGHDANEAEDYGIKVKGVAPQRERRSCLAIRFSGECEHKWEFRIQQHKGNNFAYVELLSEEPSIA